MAQLNHAYQDFEPTTEWVLNHAYDTLLIYLPGFKKEQLKVQVTSAHNLRILGECSSGDKRYRFRKDFVIRPDYDVNEISAKFESGILKIKHPKTNNKPAIKPQDTAEKTPEIQKTENEEKAEKGAQVDQQTHFEEKRNEQKEELHATSRSSGSSQMVCFKNGVCDFVMQKRMPIRTTKLVVAAGLAVLVFGLYVRNTTCPGQSHN